MAYMDRDSCKRKATLFNLWTLSVAYFGNKHMIKNNDSAAHNRDAFDDKIPATSRGAASETLAAAWRFGDI